MPVLRLSPLVRRLLARTDPGTRLVHLHTQGDGVSPPTTTSPHIWYSRERYDRKDPSPPPRNILPDYMSVSIQRCDFVPGSSLTSNDHPAEQRIRESTRDSHSQIKKAVWIKQTHDPRYMTLLARGRMALVSLWS
jgi:hypothetical protein